jgi:hypothetical protein
VWRKGPPRVSPVFIPGEYVNTHVASQTEINASRKAKHSSNAQATQQHPKKQYDVHTPTKQHTRKPPPTGPQRILHTISALPAPPTHTHTKHTRKTKRKDTHIRNPQHVLNVPDHHPRRPRRPPLLRLLRSPTQSLIIAASRRRPLCDLCMLKFF